MGYWNRWVEYLLPLFVLVVGLGALAGVGAWKWDSARKDDIDPFGIHATATAQAAAAVATPKP